MTLRYFPHQSSLVVCLKNEYNLLSVSKKGIRRNMFDFNSEFNGKRVLVTGASGGIGSSIAKMFSKLGAYVIIHGTNTEKLSTLSQELPNPHEIKTANLHSPEEAAALVTQIERIDILICNAGITKDQLSIRMTDADFASVVNVNLISSFILNREAIKKMLKNDFGRIVNISSVVAFSGNPGQSNYCASKAGIIGLTKSLAHEVARKKITVNAVAPGFVISNMTDKLTDIQKNAIFERIPMREFGKPEDVANACVFLASSYASYITGQTIHVNGGMLMA